MGETVETSVCGRLSRWPLPFSTTGKLLSHSVEATRRSFQPGTAKSQPDIVYIPSRDLPRISGVIST